MTKKNEKIEYVSKTKNGNIDFTTLKDPTRFDDNFYNEIVYSLTEAFDGIQQGGYVLSVDGYQITVNKVGSTLYILNVE